MPLAQALAGQLDAIGVVDDAVEDGVGERWDADQIVPAVHGNLAGDDERAFVVAILDDFEQIARLIGRERFGSPVVQDEQFDARQGAQESGVARIPMGDGQIGEEPGHACVENGHVFSARLVAERAGEPALAQAARPGQEQIAALGDPVASGELEEERAVEPARIIIVTPGRFSSRAWAAQSGSTRRRCPVAIPPRPKSWSSRASSVTSSASGHLSPAAAARFRLSWIVLRATPRRRPISRALTPSW